MARSLSPGVRSHTLLESWRLPALLALGSAIVFVVSASAQAPTPGTKQPPLTKPARGVDLPLRWSAEIVGAPDFATPIFDLDGQFVLLVGSRNKTEAVFLNARSGAARGELPATDFRHGGEPPVAVENRQIAFRAANQRDLLLWDLNDGKVTEIPHKITKARSLINYSSNARYIAIARRRSQPPAKTTISQLDVVDTKSGQSAISFDWQPGHVYFSADSARALVVDATDRFQWFRLPSGKADGEWRFDREPSGRNAQVLGMSDDGSVLLYAGVPPKKEFGLHLLDGKTGSVIHSFPPKTYSETAGFLSRDGNLVALLRTDGFGTAQSVEVLDRQGDLLGKVRLPQQLMSVAVSWDSSVVALFERDLKKLWVHDLPGGSTAVLARPRERDPNSNHREMAPGDATIAKAELRIRDAFKAEYARRLPAEKRELAERLIAHADETTDDPAARFVMLRDARDLAVEIHDPNLAIRAINELAKSYQVDGPVQIQSTLERIQATTSSQDACRVIADATIPAAEAAMAADEYEEAVQFALLGLNAARKGKLASAFIEEAEGRLAHAKMTRDSFAAIRPAIDAIRGAPDDAIANSTIGKYRCFVQGRWDEGLKYLARGASPALRTVADFDLKSPRNGVPDVASADRWWEYARTAPDDERWGAQSRSRHWYTRSIPGLSGMEKTRAEGRLSFTFGGSEYRPGLVCEVSSKQPAVVKGKRARIDPSIDFSGGEFADDNKQTDLTVKWTGAIAAPRSGRYSLIATTGDAVRVRVDNKTVIDTFSGKSTKREAQIVLGERPVPLVVEFVTPNTEQHRLKLLWIPVGKSAVEMIPAEYLFHDKRGESVLGKASP